MGKLLSLSASGWQSSSTLVPVSSHAKARSTQSHIYSVYLIKMKTALANGLQCMGLQCSPSKSDQEEQELPVYNRTSSKVRHLLQTKPSVPPDSCHKILGKPRGCLPTMRYISSWFHSSNLILGFWPVEKKHCISGLICILKTSCLAQPLLWWGAFFQALNIFLQAI